MEVDSMKKSGFTPEKKMAIVKEGLEPDANIAEICRKHNIHHSTFYRWRDEFLEKGIAGLENKVKNPQTREKELERQLSEAQKKIGQLTMEIEILKKKTNWGRK
jgi:transposase-like protein